MDASASGILDTYTTRCLIGLVASLSLVITLVHLPVQRPSPQIGLTTKASPDLITLSDVAPEEHSDKTSEGASEGSPPPTAALRSGDANPKPESSDPSFSENADTTRGDSDPRPKRKDVRYANALSITDRTPQIVGGKGSLYLNINYPERARSQGIEGRLILEFLVEADGSVSNIEVAESLHPLCDSAAVAGLRSVEFIPAKRDGDPIPIRLRLPVRFELSPVATATRTKPSTP